MRILFSGLLLGTGTVFIGAGARMLDDGAFLNGPVVAGLCLMSLGLFALRINVDPVDIETDIFRPQTEDPTSPELTPPSHKV